MDRINSKLIINADDFGLTPSVNRAIIDVYKAGNLSSTTLMVNMPGTKDAVKLAKNNPGLAIGLHFCITEGRPLSNAKTLMNDNGYFISRSELYKRLLKNKIDLREVKEEFVSQLQMIKSFGISITHIDSHQHTMVIPPIFKCLKPELELLNLNIRITKPPYVSHMLAIKRPPKYIKQIINYWFGKNIQKNKSIKMNDCLVTIHDLEDQININKNSYYNLIKNADNNSIIELMVHPYILDNKLFEMYPTSLEQKKSFFVKCEQEYKVLSGERLFQNYNLCSYKDINN